MITGTLQVPGEGVVVRSRDGVEFVIVAARAAHRQAEECLGVNIDLVVYAVALVAADVHRRMGRLAEMPKARPLCRFILASGRVEARLFDHVPGDVFHDKVVVRHVGVECADDVVAVAIGLWDGVIRLVPARLGKPHEVEPVLAPAFAKMRRCQQPLDEVLVSDRRCVGNERLDFRRRGRQSGEVKVQSADHRLARGRSTGGKLGLLQTGEDKLIDRGPGPAGVCIECWRLDALSHRLPCPVLGHTLGDVKLVLVSDLGGFAVAGVRCTHFDPFGQFRDCVIRQFVFGRHLQVFILVGDHLKQQAGLGVAGDNRRAGVAALEQPLTGVE